MPFNSDTFVQRLVSLRKKKHLTQEQMSDLLPVSRTGYSAWEQKKSKPDLESLIMLCEFFSVSADYLLGLSDVQTTIAKSKKSELGSLLDATIQRDPFADLTPEQRTVIESSLAAFRAANDAAASRQDA